MIAGQEVKLLAETVVEKLKAFLTSSPRLSAADVTLIQKLARQTKGIADAWHEWALKKSIK